MTELRTSRALVIGVAAAALGLLSARAVTTDPTGTPPSPADDYAAVAAEAPEAKGVARWEADREWDLPKTYNDRVGFWIEFLKGRNADRTRLWLERLGRYGPMIEAELKERGMPRDLVYLAFIESGLSPKAYSHAAASGLWQFISATGERYGLEVGRYVDERRDPVKATSAALDYLSELHDRFGSWYLAAAAYNSGENRVERVLRQHAGGAKGEESLFWKIDQFLPQETRDYVPLMLAAAYIGKNPARYGFTDLDYQKPFAYDEVVVPPTTPLSTVAEAAGADEDAIGNLNPQLVRGISPPGGAYSVRVPAGTHLAFAQNFERVYAEHRAENRVRLASYSVGRGETLSHIALRFGTTVAALVSLNDGIDPRALQVGETIRVPADGGAALASGGSPASAASTRSTYRVRRGDSLWEIARRSGVTVSDLKSWNSLGRRSTIQPGQRLRVGS